MRRTIVCMLLALLLASSLAEGANRDPIGGALVWLPYKFGIHYEGNEIVAVLVSQGYSPIRWMNDSGGAGTPVHIDFFKWYLNGDQSSFRGVMWVHTHGNSTCATHEAYLSESTRNTAFTYWLNHGWNDSQIVKSQSDDGYGISIYPSKISWEFVGGHQELVMYSSCYSNSWIRDAYNDARCTVASVGIGYASDYYEVMERLDGQQGISMRPVGQAISGITNLAKQGDGATVLAPCVIDIMPNDGNTISGATNVTVTFDSEMDSDTDYRWPLVIDNALVENLDWNGDELTFTVTPYQEGTVTIDVVALSAGVNELDGNQDPPGTNGNGPNRDAYRFTYITGEEDESPNTAVQFGGAGAFTAEDGTHIWWVTDPELGSISFEVYGGSNRSQLLASVPASGGPDRSYFYELVVPPGVSVNEAEVVEIDDDPSVDYTTHPFPVDAPPANLDQLRSMNALYGTWTPWVWEPGGRDYPPYDATNFVLYSSRSDFLDLCQPVMDWWAAKGFTWQAIEGTPSPYDCRMAAEAVYQAAIEEERPWLPFLIIVGEDNDGSVPAYNIVGTMYIEDEDDGCYWSTCASDASIVEFDGDKIPDMPWSRVPVHSTQELQYEVTSTMEFYGRLRPQSPRACIFDGDRNGICEPTVEPHATLSLIRDQLEMAGVTTVMLNETDIEGCYDWYTRHDLACDVINDGVTEVLGHGNLSSRSILPGYFLQKAFNPVFTMADVPRLQRVIFEFAGCGTGDTDRENPYNYPGIPKMFLTSNPALYTTAVAWLGHKRGGQQALYLELAREYFQRRVMYLYAPVQENLFHAIRELSIRQPAMRDFLLMEGALGFPVRFAEMYQPGATPEVAQDLPAGLTVSPNPILGQGGELSFGLRGYGRVGLQVIDLQGRCLRKLVDHEVFEPGLHRVTWDGRDSAGRQLSAGVYYARLTVNRHDRAFAKFIQLR